MGSCPCDAERIADDPTDALDLDAELDALFATPPDAFVAARNALVKRVRAAKRREEATAVAAMRKPPRAVWALNHLALSDDPHLADLLDAIDAVGAADASTHREAVAALRDRIGDTVDAAVAAIEAPRPDDHPEVTHALQAVVGDADALRLLVDGRLVEVPVGGMGALGLLPTGAAAPRAPRPEGRARPKLGVPRPPESPDEGDEVDEDEEETEGEAEEGVAAQVDDSMAARRAARERRRVEKEVAAAATAHEAAAAALERVAAAVADAEEQLAAAADEVEAAEAALAAAQAWRDEQDAAAAEARSAHEAAAAAEADARSAADAIRAELDALDT